MNGRFHRFFPLAVLSVFAAGLCGCASLYEREIVQPTRDTRMVAVRSGREYRLSWQSESNTLYTVLYTQSSSSRSAWEPLPGYQNIPGNGRMIEVVDEVPDIYERAYRLDVRPVRAKKSPAR